MKLKLFSIHWFENNKFSIPQINEYKGIWAGECNETNVVYVLGPRHKIWMKIHKRKTWNLLNNSIQFIYKSCITHQSNIFQDKEKIKFMHQNIHDIFLISEIFSSWQDYSNGFSLAKKWNIFRKNISRTYTKFDYSPNHESYLTKCQDSVGDKKSVRKLPWKNKRLRPCEMRDKCKFSPEHTTEPIHLFRSN